MNKSWFLFWYRFHRYMHTSWYEQMSVPLLTPQTSPLRFGLAYPELCQQLDLDSHLPDYQDTWRFDFIERLIRSPERYLKLAGICLSVRPKAEFYDAALMQDSDINFAKKLCKAMSLNQRFICANQFQLSSYEAGTMLLNAYIGGSMQPLWQRVKLSIDYSVIKEIDAPEGAIGVHQSVLKRLWRLVDGFISGDIPEYILEAREDSVIAA